MSPRSHDHTAAGKRRILMSAWGLLYQTGMETRRVSVKDGRPTLGRCRGGLLHRALAENSNQAYPAHRQTRAASNENPLADRRAWSSPPSARSLNNHLTLCEL